MKVKYLLPLVLSAPLASAAVIVQYDFTGDVDTATTSVYGTATALTSPTAFTVSGGTLSGDATTTAAANEFTFSYTADALAGGTLVLDSVSFDISGLHNSTRYDVYTDKAGDNTFANLAPGSSATSLTDPLFGGAGYTIADGETINFIMRYRDNSAGTVTIDNFTLNGTYTPIPEPTSAALLGLGGLALVARRRR